MPSAESPGISFANHSFVGWNIYDEQNWAMYTAERTYSAGIVTEQGKTAYVYAAYSVADVTVSGYAGEYDGMEHNITYSLPDNLSVEKYQWYFIRSGASNAEAVESEVYNSYSVKSVADSGEYYCYIEALVDNYVIRFMTKSVTVEITRKPISVKAADGRKIHDTQPLAENGVELSADSSLAQNHTMVGIMTADSTITNVGAHINKIEKTVISDDAHNDVTENYEITKENGTLSVLPLNLTVSAENVSVSAGELLQENNLYKINGVLGNEKLSLANTAVTAKNSDGEIVDFADITKNIGVYTVAIVYNGFDGDGSGNYTGSGTITSEVTVYRRSSGGSGGGGG